MSIIGEKEVRGSGTKKHFLSVIVGIYVLFIMAGLPLVFRNKYFDILVTKYYFYCICTISMLVLAAGYFVVAGRTRAFLKLRKLSFRSLRKQLNGSDYAVLVFLLISIISTLNSNYPYEAFWGNEGRLTGLFLISLYVLSYFFVSRFWRLESWYFDCMLAAGMLVCIFGITDYFQMDILHFKVDVIEKQKAIFTSTLGNINTYTAYVGIIMAASTVLFATSRKAGRISWYYICMVISFFAVIMGVSDNAYLSLAALFGLLPLYLSKHKGGIKRYFIILATFFTVIKCIGWINVVFKDTVLGIDSAFNIVISFRELNYLVLGLWIICMIWHYIDSKQKSRQNGYGAAFQYVWIGILLLIVLVIAYVLYDCNAAGNAERYKSISSYLLLNDDWGSHRGYIWRNAMECFYGFSPWKKIIGSGPETFGILLLQKTARNPYHEIFDNAHNEYLHYLITVGIAGAASYIAFLVCCIKNCFKNKNNIYIMAAAFSIICYSVQAFVNLSLPITAPILWLLLGMGSSRTILE